MANTNVKRVKTSDLELKDRLVAIQRVTKVTKGGRHFRFAAIVVVGDENGVVGYGLGKANEVTAAIAKGVEDASRFPTVIEGKVEDGKLRLLVHDVLNKRIVLDRSFA